MNYTVHVEVYGFDGGREIFFFFFFFLHSLVSTNTTDWTNIDTALWAAQLTILEE